MKWQIKSRQPWILYPYSVLTVQTIVFLHSTVIQILGNRVLKCCQKQFNCPSWWIAIEYHGLPLPKWLEREREKHLSQEQCMIGLGKWGYVFFFIQKEWWNLPTCVNAYRVVYTDMYKNLSQMNNLYQCLQMQAGKWQKTLIKQNCTHTHSKYA